MQICAARDNGQGLMRRRTAHIRAEIGWKKRGLQKTQICSVRIVHAEYNTMFFAYGGNAFYIKNVSEVIGTCQIYSGRLFIL